MSSDTVFTKENLDAYLKELAKEFRKLNGAAMSAELILIGGAAVLANYGFRDMTADIDAVIQASSAMKDAINRVGDKFKLPNGWLNADFMRTESYSAKLAEVSTYYKTFSHILEIRTISAEYLIAMKLRAGRKYKNDLSDIVGILAEHEKRGTPLSRERITHAVETLYGGWAKMPMDAKQFIDDVMQNGSYAEIYAAVSEQEKQAGELLIKFEKNYPHVVTDENAEEIIKTLKARL